ncbi:hypothetical protein GCM10010129_49150 [Streptomyces fumigatiscleroticus]|nr:hypothetical protein GCM10010129_49150 [Streptomyces fumigatiscleroticus]
MTSTTDMSGHPDVAEISDLSEGLLPPSRSADVRRHLDECELCADVYASLEEIRGLLGSLPGPPRMPADVAGRIDAALAAEALLNATALPGAHEAAVVGVSGSAPDEDTGVRVSRETSVPAARPGGRARMSTTGPGRKDRRREQRRRIAVLGSVFAAAVLGLGSVLLASFQDGDPSDNTAHRQQSAAADTFSEGKLEKQVADLLDQNPGARTGSRTPRSLGVESESESGTEGPRVFKQPTVPDCVQQGIGRSEPALATEEGTFKGTEALLVILPDASDDTRVTAYIVESTCADQPSAATAKVLLKRSYVHS